MVIMDSLGRNNLEVEVNILLLLKTNKNLFKINNYPLQTYSEPQTLHTNSKSTVVTPLNAHDQAVTSNVISVQCL